MNTPRKPPDDEPTAPEPEAPRSDAPEPEARQWEAPQSEARAPDASPRHAVGANVRGQAQLALLGAVVGLPAAVLAAAFLALVHTVEHGLWHDLPAALGAAAPPWYLVLGLPVVGAAIVWAVRRFLPGDGGHRPTGGLDPSPMPLRQLPGVALAALGSLPFGAVLGPEAPLIAIGGAAGGALAHLARLTKQKLAVLTIAGSFSAISALFGGPLVASFMLIEVGAGTIAALVPTLMPGLVAAGIGYLIFVGVGDWGGVAASALRVPGLPPYHATSLLDLAVAVAVGVVVAAVVVVTGRLGAAIEVLAQRLGIGIPLLAGGFVIGVLALIVSGLGGRAEDVLFSGQASLPAVTVVSSVGALLILLGAKALAYAVSLGCGFRGGPVFPAIFIGVAVAMIPAAVFGQSAAVAVAVGAAAGMAACTRLLFSPVLFAALLVGIGGQDTVPAAVLASVAAWLTTTAVSSWLSSLGPTSVDLFKRRS
jgi:H+/Cl- antiporter ClcA